MIPRIIHYCWFGGGDLPDLAEKCIASWRKHMPDYEYKLWNEENFDVNATVYTKEAYQVKKYAFVSDYVRLLALYNMGGLYMDVDFEVFKPFDDLMVRQAFAGFEGSKTRPVMMGVIASQPHGKWVKQMLDAYQGRRFVNEAGELDLTTNVRFITDIMVRNGFVANGKEQDYKDLHVFPVDYFCPRQTTGEYLRTSNTYCDHLGMSSWGDSKKTWKQRLVRILGRQYAQSLIQLKRKIFG